MWGKLFLDSQWLLTAFLYHCPLILFLFNTALFLHFHHILIATLFIHFHSHFRHSIWSGVAWIVHIFLLIIHWFGLLYVYFVHSYIFILLVLAINQLLPNAAKCSVLRQNLMFDRVVNCFFLVICNFNIIHIILYLLPISGTTLQSLQHLIMTHFIHKLIITLITIAIDTDLSFMYLFCYWVLILEIKYLLWC